MTFKTKRIADVIDEIAMGPFGSNIKVECFVPSGVPILDLQCKCNRSELELPNQMQQGFECDWEEEHAMELRQPKIDRLEKRRRLVTSVFLANKNAHSGIQAITGSGR